MQTKIGSHYADDTLERYALSDLPGDLTAEFEEHLLLCESCQQRLEQAEQFLSVTRVALADVCREKAQPVRKGMALAWMLGGPRVVFGGIMAVLALAVAIPAMRDHPPTSLATSNVDLHMARGVGEDMSAYAVAGKLVLNADVSELRQFSVYVLQLVAGDGAEVWKGQVPAVDQKLHQEVPVPVQRGRYWVRVYGMDGVSLLREYGLEVK